MIMKLLVDSGEFWQHLRRDIASSRDRFFLQTLSFEGDRVGKSMAGLLSASSLADIRVIVDRYTKWVLSDKFLYFPMNLMDPALRLERRETDRMIRALRQNGVQLKFTNPMGLFLRRFPARNHKKMILIDGRIAYIGGINFSEHNFSWHDLMIRIEDEGVAQMLEKDFLCTWGGIHASSSMRFPGIEIHIVDGRSNHETVSESILQLIDGARDSVFVESPYLTFPFFDRLCLAKERGVEIRVIAPEKNNRRFVERYTLWESERSGIELWLYPGMTHLKAMLIDGRYLIAGSSNFDYLAHTVQQELVAIVTDERLVADFSMRVAKVDMERSRRYSGKSSALRGRLLNYGFRTIAGFLSRISRPG